MDHNSNENFDMLNGDNNASDRNENPSEYYKEESKNMSAHNSNLEDENGRESIVGAQYIPDLHGLGRERQALSCKVNVIEIPGQVTPYHTPNDDTCSYVESLYDEDGIPLTTTSNGGTNEKKLWSWTSDGKLKLLCSQPIIPVSVVQDILRRDKIILIPQVEVTDFVIPKVYSQNIKHDIPKLDINVKCSNIQIPNVKYVDKEIIIPIITGYTHKFIPKWEIHKVPRPIVKYIGEQKIVEVQVPEIKYVDKIVEKEIIVDTVEKRIPKIIEIPKYVDEVQYVWKPIEKIVYIQKLVPKFDVNLECPPPLIVPYPVQTIKQIPPVMIKKDTKIPDDCNYNDSLYSPEGSLPIPKEYITHFTTQQQKSVKGMFSTCCTSNMVKCTDDQHNTYHDGMPYNTGLIPAEMALEDGLNICSYSNSFVNRNQESVLKKRENQPVHVNA
ncbi:inner membrane complex protein 1k, putative [Plasmodium malariae]|uniref:Inner membrane complex protein 1k, putative n=1 Tax=Plasmodium malariae TaxID=5858 RepID=A0A1C3L0D5_PLAMA|nr:inner membrane complex protein 1k, putative [Plasmodium malariae]